ncbi:MAG: hypothetical protein ABMA64_32255 [Myxococcota bacterium]
MSSVLRSVGLPVRRAWFALGLLTVGAPAWAERPVREVSESLPVPEGMDPLVALAAVEHIPAIFELYQPIIPWVPGVSIDLEKQVVSASAPCVLELPVRGSAVGTSIAETARVTATSEPARCGPGGTEPGRKITLDFEDSTYNIERRIDRIEITACLTTGSDGSNRVSAVGRMYAGYKPEDPRFNPVSEAIGTKALQTAFIKQVSAVLVAVQQHWTQVAATPTAGTGGTGS